LPYLFDLKQGIFNLMSVFFNRKPWNQDQMQNMVPGKFSPVPLSSKLPSIYASGGQGAFLKNRPLDPQKTFY
jgi:hypothetical protein